MKLHSPQAAAEKAERLRRQKRKERIILIAAILLVGSSSVLALYLKYHQMSRASKPTPRAVPRE